MILLRYGKPLLQDNSEVGIRAMLSRLSSLLNQVDPELWYHLTHKNKVRFAALCVSVTCSLT